ncbi:gag/pol protein [Cucumis melo var. makuwa]|uniref:Gag/pol protein n=1 Tax=Cucumis melo var. makuwa TaxID=1194695 RepID=A0A5D3DQQ9_CUCMM|nr:gag/pol protein [Cucumis melo var. makuwa]TYK26011.1 gag/pol protein [Cucumis melo var. makuwa]
MWTISSSFGNDVGYLTDVKTWLAAQFQMKDLGETQYVLGIQIIGDRKNKTLALSQATYIDKILVRFSVQNSKKDLLPFRHRVHLSKEQCPKTPQEVENMRCIPYASVVGSLVYVMLCTRLDISYVVRIASRYQSNPSIKQGCIADSTIEAEYVAACEATKEAVWLRKFLHDLEVVPNMNLPITLRISQPQTRETHREEVSPDTGDCAMRGCDHHQDRFGAQHC